MMRNEEEECHGGKRRKLAPTTNGEGEETIGLLSHNVSSTNHLSSAQNLYTLGQKITHILRLVKLHFLKGRPERIFPLVKNHLLTTIIFLVPSFLHRTTTPSKLHSTSYLDGLRGVAAFFVFIHHSVIDWYPFLKYGYGSSADDHNIFQLPFIRLLYSGGAMVCIFFVISGFVLSKKGLMLSRNGEHQRLLDLLASSVFRRAMRLHIPTIISSFLSMLMVRLNWYEKRHWTPKRLGTFSEQWAHWWLHTQYILNPFQEIGGREIYWPPYNFHLWTIPMEVYGSMIVFISLLAFCKLPEILRIILLAGFTLYSLWSIGYWPVFLFLSGTTLAAIHVWETSPALPPQLAPATQGTSTLYLARFSSALPSYLEKSTPIN
ncbi:uncharacterized protein LY89DRAFT_338870 [Mollisia scopiformis]|uniref:Acyltransferase 3 domain-containing protein n=1 Tax=Mollisia scopiformis TaxID=149040 RepID=A0A132B760_MOLSC|nr:uncharacterized protein LY89DRAFT_338870 [Mollisia scopiformis]KUJ08245.1 hypothetical protein LY89DRAFT_338870 [Mollisia scopiformis]